MMIKDLPTELLKKRLKEEREKNQALELMGSYTGADRVVTIHEAVKLQEGEEKGHSLSSGIPALDDITGGFRTGELVVVSGPTGMGKTTLLQSMTYEFSDNDIPSLWFSYEVGVSDLSERFGGMVPDFVLPYKMIDSDFNWLVSKVYEGIAKFGVRVIFIDHLHFLLDMEELAKTNTSLAIGHLMRRLKKFAVETNTLIFLVSHVAKTKFESEPEISDLRDSSFIGQESDYVLLIWRHEDKAFLKVAKNRRLGTLKSVALTLQNGRFYALT